MVWKGGEGTGKEGRGRERRGREGKRGEGAVPQTKFLDTPLGTAKIDQGLLVQYMQIPRRPIYCQNPLLAHSTYQCRV